MLARILGRKGTIFLFAPKTWKRCIRSRICGFKTLDLYIFLRLGICRNGDSSDFLCSSGIHSAARRCRLHTLFIICGDMLQCPSGTDFRHFPPNPPSPNVQRDPSHPLGRHFIAAVTMTIHWYRLAVFALWLAAMSWLSVRKILPPFFIGEPPAYESVGGEQPRPPVGWRLS